jgi:hypothetical protein
MIAFLSEIVTVLTAKEDFVALFACYDGSLWIIRKRNAASIAEGLVQA